MSPYWYRNYINSLTGITYWQDLVKGILNDDRVNERLDDQDTVTMKIRKGGKVYRVVVSDITPVEEKIEIEFEGDEPSRHLTLLSDCTHP